MRPTFREQLTTFLKGESVSKALRYTIGAMIPLLLLMAAGNEKLGVELMLGTILVSGADIKEPLAEKARTLLVTALLSFSLTIVTCLLAWQYWLLIPVMFVIVFLLSYAAPFGDRYASIAFMGNLAIIIALSTYRLYEDVPAIIAHALTLGAGSLWYMGYALSIHFFTEQWQVKQLIVRAMHQTAAYLQQRVAMFQDQASDWKALMLLSEKQAELTTTHGELRDFLLQHTYRLLRSGSVQRKMLLLFAEMVDMLEAALATPLDYLQWHAWLRKYPELHIIPEISQLEIRELERLTETISSGRAWASLQEEAALKIAQARQMLEQFHREAPQDAGREKIYQQAMRISLYQEVQLKKLKSMHGIWKGELNQTESAVDDTAHHRFVNPRILTWNNIRSNFNLQSSYFRYALRTSVAAVAGFMLGTFLGLVNAYWVMLTVLVIMKPGYAVTRQRFVHRMIGTVLGASIAYGFYLLEPSHGFSLTIFGLALFFAFSFVPYIYAVSTIFFTIFVVFLYSFLQREIPNMILYRIVDTSLGAMLCYLALHYLWPSWEQQSFPYYLRNSVKASRNLLRQITFQLLRPAASMTEYRLARKNAYVEMGNLVSSFQRFQSEPEKRKKLVTAYGDMLLLNYALLATISTLGVYMHRHPSLQAGLQYLQKAFIEVGNRLDTLINHMQQDQHLFQLVETSVLQYEANEPAENQQEPAAQTANTEPTQEEEGVHFVAEQLEQLRELVSRLEVQLLRERRKNTSALQHTEVS